MISQGLLSLLVCPETHQELELMEPMDVERINRKISDGLVITRSGSAMSALLSAALIRRDRKVIYPVREDIPIMLIEESFETAALGDPEAV